MKEPPQPPSTQPPPSSSPFLRDISNFKTPKPSLQNPNPSNPPSPLPLFFTASKQTPFSSSSSTSAFRRRPSVLPTSSKSKAARRLKAFELEQSQSSRKAQIRREKTVRTLSKSLAAWLNFLFENPRSCGCNVAVWDENNGSESAVTGKRDSLEGRRIRIDRPWRSPKRHRDCSWRASPPVSEGQSFSSWGAVGTRFSSLKVSLQDVCSFEDLNERMEMYLTVKSREEVLSMMSQVAKNIDEGRLKMKTHCPLVTDLGMKEKATRILMSYNAVWLRIGLHIIFGGDSLLPSENLNSDQDDLFLKMIIDRLFFSHAGLAKSYAYNKMVEGLYRPGYFEALGNVILKRFLFLVLVLDKAKYQSTLPLKYGIDGIDGGSPLLFNRQSHIKSSRQIIHEFLSPVMHGEGNLLAHLVIVGYKVSYQQSPLVEYDFRIMDLFEDFQDGIRLCRVVQLLLCEPSILMKVAVPSDCHKKNLLNCGVAMHYIKQAGLPLSDQDGILIIAEDVANGDKELILSLLWIMFVSLQLPLLINKTLLAKEIAKINRSDMDHLMSKSSTHLDLLLEWIQAICKSYHFKVDSFASLVNGKALCYLSDYYCRNDLHGSSFLTEAENTGDEESVLSKTDNTDILHKFILVQRLATMLGDFPEVLQTSDILENDPSCNEKSVIILLIFLSSQLIGRRNMDKLNIHKLMGWNDRSLSSKSDMDQLGTNKFLGLNYCSLETNASVTIQSLPYIEHAVLPDRNFGQEKPLLISEETLNHNGLPQNNSEDAVRRIKIIQSWWRATVRRNDNTNVNHSISVVKQSIECNSLNQQISEIQREKAAKIIQSHFRGSTERHNYRKIRNATSFLQTVVRAWLKATRKNAFPRSEIQKSSYVFERYLEYMIERHRFIRVQKSVLLIQHATRTWIFRRKQGQSRLFSEAKAFADTIAAATTVQSYIRGAIQRSRYVGMVAGLQESESVYNRLGLSHQPSKAVTNIPLAAIKIQSIWRGQLARRGFQYQMGAIIKLQSAIRSKICSNTLKRHTFAATEIQRFVRGHITRTRILGSSCFCLSRSRGGSLVETMSNCIRNPEFEVLLQSVLKLQRWWKKVLLLKARTSSAIIIQSHSRGWIARREANRERHHLIVKKFLAATRIQSHWRGWLLRRDFLCKKEAITKIQRSLHSLKCFKVFKQFRLAATEIQRFARGQIARNRLLGASSFHPEISVSCPDQIRSRCFCSLEFKIFLHSVVKIQRWWKRFLILESRTKSALVIQSHVRGWIARCKASISRHRIIVIQSYWRGYLVRKGSREQLLNLRHRVQKSAANVDNSMRLMSRLVAALSLLLSDRVSNILHTCATLDMATELSQKCCETLVAAGAIGALLNQIHAANRSTPFQEVTRHALSTLRNLCRYPHLAEVLINTHGSVEIIFLELLRNKEEGYFIAADLLKKLCTKQEGAEAVQKLPAFLKRLDSLVQDLERKSNLEMRNPRLAAARENTERRLKEAAELLQLITN